MSCPYRAIQASLALTSGESFEASCSTTPDDELLKAIAVSKNELMEEQKKREEEEERRRLEEEALLEKVLQLSLTDK